MALGAGRVGVARQLLVEALALALAGALAGLVVAEGLLALLARFELPGGVPLALLDVGVDGRVFAFALALSAVTGVAFGLVPAARASRQDIAYTASGVRRAGPRAGGHRHRGGRELLVSRRRREIGIRLVLGASRRRITSGAVTAILGPVLAGALAGVGGALLLGRAVEAFLVEARADDPWTYATVAAVLLAVAAAAAWLPARRAARVDPVAVLRAE